MPRLHYLDSLRGIAALVVLFNHFVYVFGIPQELTAYPQLQLHLLWDGQAAVGLFFVLSGFVLAKGFLRVDSEPPRKEMALVPFYVARVFRIFPAFAATLAVSALVRHALLLRYPELYETGAMHSFWRSPAGPLAVLRELLFLDGGSVLLYQAWTLKWEIYFSLLLPFLILAANRGTSWLIALTVVSLTLFHVEKYLFHFSIGLLLHRALPYFHVARARLHAALWPLCLLGALFLLAFRYTPPFDFVGISRQDLVVHIKAVGAFLVLGWVIATPRCHALLERQPLRYLGTVSYSVYLLHYFILICFGGFYGDALRALGLGDGSLFRWTCLAVTALLTALAAAPLYYGVELPAIRWGKKLAALRLLTTMPPREAERPRKAGGM